MPTLYYAALDQDMTPLGLFRVISDDDAETLDTEYLTADGTWKPDPSVIDELHEPGVVQIDASDVADIADALTGGQGAQAVADAPDDQAAEKQPVPGSASPPE